MVEGRIVVDKDGMVDKDVVAVIVDALMLATGDLLAENFRDRVILLRPVKAIALGSCLNVQIQWNNCVFVSCRPHPVCGIAVANKLCHAFSLILPSDWFATVIRLPRDTRWAFLKN